MIHSRGLWTRFLLVPVFCLFMQAAIPANDILRAQESASTFTGSLPLTIGPYLNPIPELAAKTVAADAQLQPGVAGNASAPGREVSWRRLPSNILRDQKDLWLFPVQLAHGRHWLPAVAVVGVTAGLLAADAHDAPYFRRTSSFSGFNSAFSGRTTALGIALVPSAMYGIGLVRKDSYAQQTALLAGEAAFDSGVLAIAMKDVSRRLRPSDVAPYGDFSGTFFRSRPVAFGQGSAFPSGHATLAFAVATVIARRYGKRHSWVPWVAYGTAGAIGFSRITLQAHFPSDVFLGAALGYSIARFDVLRDH
jgi:membrane-associated phospholipid phosphatase